MSRSHPVTPVRTPPKPKAGSFRPINVVPSGSPLAAHLQQPRPGGGTDAKFGGQPQFAAAELLRAFMNAYWLRPENALWMCLRSMVLRSARCTDPSIDISCGDGVFTFLHLGGRFAPSFDVFAAVDKLDRVRRDHADMFDCPPERSGPAIIAAPQSRMTVGADLKPNLLQKAAQLKVYERQVQNDNNAPLPFPKESFNYIYCNAAYWVERVDDFLAELRRILRPGGRVALQVKLSSMEACTLQAFREQLGDRFLDLIGRGRMRCWPTLADRLTWERRFARAGLAIECATPFVTRTHAHLWDVGLRPLAPLLVRMANHLASPVRVEIKQDWVDLWCDLLAPFCRFDADLFPPSEPAEIQYELTRSA